jgi:hypothetical protein
MSKQDMAANQLYLDIIEWIKRTRVYSVPVLELAFNHFEGNRCMFPGNIQKHEETLIAQIQDFLVSQARVNSGEIKL